MPLKHIDIINLIPYLAFNNFNGKDIYISQANGIDRALILVDDLNRLKIKEMVSQGVEPACVIETSPNNFQVWVSLGPEHLSKDERKIIARLLAQQFLGDRASVDANHYGRLAGFTNRKDKYYTKTGYPFVRCWEATGKDANKSQELRSWARERYEAEKKEKNLVSNYSLKRQKSLVAERDPKAIFNQYFNQWLEKIRDSGKSLDISRGDYAVTCRMLKEVYEKEEIIAALLNSSPEIKLRKIRHKYKYLCLIFFKKKK
ncbi:MAG: RepB family DNA primase [Deltaproteobacteria bacterium]|jgi:hypothetical protein|nr:RepB family DNA primase [Deltaproteobacteria bacterium]